MRNRRESRVPAQERGWLRELTRPCVGECRSFSAAHMRTVTRTPSAPCLRDPNVFLRHVKHADATKLAAPYRQQCVDVAQLA